MSSDKVRDEALEKAYEIVSLMLAKRPDVKQYMVNKGCHVMIIGEHEEVCDLPEYAHICNTPENIAFWNKRARGFGGAPEDDFRPAVEKRMCWLSRVTNMWEKIS